MPSKFRNIPIAFGDGNERASPLSAYELWLDIEEYLIVEVFLLGSDELGNRCSFTSLAKLRQMVFASVLNSILIRWYLHLR